MSKTDKISTHSKITVDMIQLSIVLVMMINSGLILRAEKRKQHLKWLEQRVIFGYVCGLILFWVTSYMSLQILKFPHDVENLLTVRLPRMGRDTSAVLSKVVTFFTSGFMGVITGIVINVFSNCVYDKIKAWRKNGAI